MPSPTLYQLGEDAVLARLLSLFPPAQGDAASLLLGPGDDCAILRRDDRWDSLLKTDALVEGVHFTPGTDPELIGRKALARAVSDIAAMGGIPEHVLVSLFVHPARSIDLPEGIYRGMACLAQEFSVSLIGGESSSLPSDGLALSISLVGRVEHGQAILRSGGNPGDVLCVSGCLGGSFRSGHHLLFTPRVELGRLLQHHVPRPTAMMDLSDGLSADLPRLAQACRCGFDIQEDLLPCNPGCSPQQALSDGEDYELLLALPPEGADATCAELGLTRIGVLTPPGHPCPPLPGGWQHFSSIPHSPANAPT